MRLRQGPLKGLKAPGEPCQEYMSVSNLLGETEIAFKGSSIAGFDIDIIDISMGARTNEKNVQMSASLALS